MRLIKDAKGGGNGLPLRAVLSNRFEPVHQSGCYSIFILRVLLLTVTRYFPGIKYSKDQEAAYDVYIQLRQLLGNVCLFVLPLVSDALLFLMRWPRYRIQVGYLVRLQSRLWPRSRCWGPRCHLCSTYYTVSKLAVPLFEM